MFHLRLAAKFCCPYVDALVDSLTRGEIKELEASALIDGWHHGQSQLGEVVAAIHNQTNELSLMQFPAADRESVHNSMTWLSGSAVVKALTWFGKRMRKKRTANSPEQALAMMEAKYGKNNDNTRT